MCLDLGMSANYRSHYQSLIVETIRYSSTRCLELLVRYNVDVNSDFGYPIQVAARENSLDKAEVLLKAGANVYTYNPAISIALLYASHTFVLRLLSAGAVLPTPNDTLRLIRNTQIDRLLKIDFIHNRRNYE